MLCASGSIGIQDGVALICFLSVRVFWHSDGA
jgi:hypothetical protein